MDSLAKKPMPDHDKRTWITFFSFVLLAFCGYLRFQGDVEVPSWVLGPLLVGLLIHPLQAVWAFLWSVGKAMVRPAEDEERGPSGDQMTTVLGLFIVVFFIIPILALSARWFFDGMPPWVGW